MRRQAKERRHCQAGWLFALEAAVKIIILGDTLRLGRARREAQQKRVRDTAAARQIERWFLRLRFRWKLRRHQESVRALRNFIRRWALVHRKRRRLHALVVVRTFLHASYKQGKCLRGLKKFKRHVQILQRAAYDFLSCRHARLHVLHLKLSHVEVEKQHELAQKRHELEKEAQQALKMSSNFNRIASKLQHTSSQVKKVLDQAAERATRKDSGR